MHSLSCMGILQVTYFTQASKKQLLTIKVCSIGPFWVANSHLIKAGPVMQPFMWFNLGVHEIFQVIWYERISTNTGFKNKAYCNLGDSEMTQSTPDATYASTNVSNILSGWDKLMLPEHLRLYSSFLITIFVCFHVL